VPLDFADTVTYRGMMFSAYRTSCGLRLLSRELDLRVDLSVISSTACSCTWTNSERRGSRRDSGRGLEDQWLEWVDVEYFNPNIDAFDAPHAQRLDKPECATPRTTGPNETNCRWSISTRLSVFE